MRNTACVASPTLTGCFRRSLFHQLRADSSALQADFVWDSFTFRAVQGENARGPLLRTAGLTLIAARLRFLMRKRESAPWFGHGYRAAVALYPVRGPCAP